MLPRGESGENPRLVRRETKALSKVELGIFRARFREVNFWELPPREGEAGLDGSAWTFEALIGGRYRIVSRWSPKAGTPFQELGRSMIEQAIGGDLVPIY